jgi:hypothetical protein
VKGGGVEREGPILRRRWERQGLEGENEEGGKWWERCKFPCMIYLFARCVVHLFIYIIHISCLWLPYEASESTEASHAIVAKKKERKKERERDRERERQRRERQSEVNIFIVRVHVEDRRAKKWQD